MPYLRNWEADKPLQERPTKWRWDWCCRLTGDIYCLAHGAWVWRKTQWGCHLGSQKDRQCLWELLWIELLVHGTCWSLHLSRSSGTELKWGMATRKIVTYPAPIHGCLFKKKALPTNKEKENKLTTEQIKKLNGSLHFPLSSSYCNDQGTGTGRERRKKANASFLRLNSMPHLL